MHVNRKSNDTSKLKRVSKRISNSLQEQRSERARALIAPWEEATPALREDQDTACNDAHGASVTNLVDEDS